MRIAVSMLLTSSVLISSVADAAGFGGASGRNAQGQKVQIHAGPDDSVVISVPIQGGAGDALEFDMLRECPSWDWASQMTSFSCSGEGRSPLAGATYSVEISDKLMNVCGEPQRVYRCIDGCGPKSVPALIEVDPWEC